MINRLDKTPNIIAKFPQNCFVVIKKQIIAGERLFRYFVRGCYGPWSLLTNIMVITVLLVSGVCTPQLSGSPTITKRHTAFGRSKDSYASRSKIYVQYENRTRNIPVYPKHCRLMDFAGRFYHLIKPQFRVTSNL